MVSGWGSALVLVSAVGATGSGPGGAAATVWLACEASCGVRSESLAITIVIAATRTASPASCPPIRRESSGSEDAVEVALVTLRFDG